MTEKEPKSENDWKGTENDWKGTDNDRKVLYVPSQIVWLTNSPFVSPALSKLSWISLQKDEISKNSLQINITA